MTKLHMIRNKSGRYTKRSHEESYWSTFNYYRFGLFLGLLILIGYLIGKAICTSQTF